MRPSLGFDGAGRVRCAARATRGDAVRCVGQVGVRVIRGQGKLGAVRARRGATRREARPRVATCGEALRGRCVGRSSCKLRRAGSSVWCVAGRAARRGARGAGTLRRGRGKFGAVRGVAGVVGRGAAVRGWVDQATGA